MFRIELSQQGDCMKLILFGGIQGVGKTTLLSWIKNEFAGKIKLLNPGALFRRYHYNKKIKTTQEIEELIVNKLGKMPNDSAVVVHWHYAVRRPSRYIPQISFSRLKRIAESGNIEKIVLLLVSAPVDIVRERRLKDSRKKKRAFSRSAIRKEVAADEKFLIKHQILFSQILGDSNVKVVRLINNDLQTTRLFLGNLFESMLS
ncbi:MAG: hypothetical protein A3J67_02930 [Parcubacteria group bacterium RIFCSPHIGHO2_02_FULL_48_10b]|nr:MAG: hypothetical protein A3J67_02930 [Parcubacteria group bacterium RIFCSPHIGHO2_02_FULL_48_10b]